MNFIDSLRARRFDVKRTGVPDEVTICCPFCDDTKYKLGLNVKLNLGHCFKCNWKSRKAMEILQRVFGLALAMNDAVQDAANSTPIEKTTTRVALPEAFVPVLSLKKESGLFSKPYRYLKGRGLTETQMRETQVGACFEGRYAYRVVFPVFFQRKLQGLVARDFTGMAEPKYLNSPNLKSLYNARQPTRSIVLSEGILKSLAIGRALQRASAATLGKSISELQVDQLRGLGVKRVFLWPDPNAAGIEGYSEVATELTKADFAVTMIWPPPADADELTPEDIRRHFTIRHPWSLTLDWKLRALVGRNGI